MNISKYTIDVSKYEVDDLILVRGDNYKHVGRVHMFAGRDGNTSKAMIYNLLYHGAHDSGGWIKTLSGVYRYVLETDKNIEIDFLTDNNLEVGKLKLPDGFFYKDKR